MFILMYTDIQDVFVYCLFVFTGLHIMGVYSTARDLGLKTVPMGGHYDSTGPHRHFEVDVHWEFVNQHQA